MRSSKGFWIWGLFPIKETVFLSEIKNQVQSKLFSPVFETHITLAGPYLKMDNIFLNKLRDFGKSNSPITLEVDGYEFKNERFESFYISIKNSENLSIFRKKINALNKFDVNQIYSPHISLAYGNHKIDKKHALISELPKFYKKIKISKIALVKVDEQLNLWQLMETFDLGLKK